MAIRTDAFPHATLRTVFLSPGKSRAVQVHVAVALSWLLPAGLFACAAEATENYYEAPGPAFSAPRDITNPYWPLKGSIYWQNKVLLYVKTPLDDEPEDCEVNFFNVTNDFSKVVSPVGGVGAVPVAVVRDQEWMDYDCDGIVDFKVEDTCDYLAQDDNGHIWYAGEATWAFCDEGEDECPDGAGPFSDGAWEAGVDGAEAGIIMLPYPVPNELLGVTYQQEFYEDVAEDEAKVLRNKVKMIINGTAFATCITSKEGTPLEPGAVEQKTYCPDGDGDADGYGLVLIREISGGKTEHVDLVRMMTDRHLGSDGPVMHSAADPGDDPMCNGIGNAGAPGYCYLEDPADCPGG